MTILYADGFELGTTLAEANLMSGGPLNTLGLLTSTITFGAASSGNGRSIVLALTTASTSNAAQSALSTPLTLLDSNEATMSSFVWGFRAKLNPSFGTLTSGFGSNVAVGSNGSSIAGVGFSRASGAATLALYSAGALIGAQVAVDTTTLHYYTLFATRLTGNSFSVSWYLDNTLVYTSTATLSFASTGNQMYYHTSTGGSTTAQQVNVFSEIDDVYFAVNQGPLGDLMIVRTVPTTDVAAGFTTYGTGITSNHQAVDKISLDATTGLLVPSATTVDTYGQATATPTGRRIAAVKTTVYGIGQSTDSIEATQKSNSLTAASASTPLSPFGGTADTGWLTTLANTSLADLEFGVTRV